MLIISWLCLIIVILLATTGQLSLKYAFSNSSLNKENSKNNFIRDLLFSVYFWIWFICYVVLTILWLVVLKTIPLSQAFPVLGLTFALVPITSYFLLREKVVFTQWLGIVTIVAGIVLVVQK